MSPPPAPDFGPDFEVIRPLGQGAMATVFLAREVGLRRLVAIKVLNTELARDEVARRRFEREAQAAARLSHPNITKVHRVAASDDGRPYLVMEYVDGRNLAEALEARSIDREAALLILLQLARALTAAHKMRIVHRDVRPENVIWDPEARRAVLMDFGIAAVLETGTEAVTRLTKAGQLLGDPQYSSPEQVLGEPLTGRADVYALAVLAYRLFSEHGPFEASGVAQTIEAHLKEEPRRLSLMAAGVPDDLDALLFSCLAKEPNGRPTSKDVARRVEALVTGRVGADPAHGLPTPDPNKHALQVFYEELKQRRVFRVAGVYAASTYALLEVASLILPELPVPSWTYTAVVAVTLAGFPVAMVLSWVFDVEDGGLQRTARSNSDTWGGRALRWAGLGVSLALAGAIGWWVLGSG